MTGLSASRLAFPEAVSRPGLWFKVLRPQQLPLLQLRPQPTDSHLPFASGALVRDLHTASGGFRIRPMARKSRQPSCSPPSSVLTRKAIDPGMAEDSWIVRYPFSV